MRYGITALTRGGLDLGDRIHAALPDSTVYTMAKWGRRDCETISGPFDAFVGGIFKKHQVLIFITAAGIAVRGMAKHIEDKTTDPAVLVLDEKGRFVISLLSGHLGGANEEALLVAEKIGAVPVITTSSDVQGLPSVDMMAKRYGLRVSSMDKAKEITSLMVNGSPVAMVNDTGAEIENPFPAGIDEAEGIIYISNREIENREKPWVSLIPQNIIIGIGSRKGAAALDIIELIDANLRKLGLSRESIKCFSTAEVKKDEEGIREAARHYDREIKIMTLDEIRGVEERFDKSQYVKDMIGVYSVSEPCAYLASNRTGRMLLQKEKMKGITIALWEEEWR